VKKRKGGREESRKGKREEGRTKSRGRKGVTEAQDD